MKMLQIEQQKLKLKVLNKIEPTKALSFVYAKTTYPFMERSDIMKTFLGITTGLLSGFLIGVVFSIKASAPANAEIPTEAEPEEPVKTTPKKSTKKTSTTKNKES